MIELLAVSSLLTLVVPGVVTFALCQVLFLLFVVNRLLAGHRMSRSAFAWSILSLSALVLAVLVAQKVPPVDECLKALNFFLILLAVRPGDAQDFLAAARKYIFPSIILTIVLYLAPLPFPTFIGKEYDKILLFGRPTNSGIFFEMNYAAMVSSLVVLTLKRRSIRIGMAGFVSALYTFRTGLILIPMLIVERFRFAKRRAWWLIAAVAWIGALYIAYKVGPLVLEQRFYIWNAFINSYAPFEIYSKQEMATLVYYGMADSPWGAMTNLHSGMMEHLAHRGIFSTLLVIAAFGTAFLRAGSSDKVPLLYVFCLSFIMSLGLGGLNFLALFTSLLLAGILVEPRKHAEDVNEADTGVARLSIG